MSLTLDSSQHIPPWFSRPVPSLEMKRVAVIGAGISGCSLAYALCQRGFEVSLFDRDGLAMGGSGNPVGILQPAPSLSYAPPSALMTCGYVHTRQLIQELIDKGYNIPHGFDGCLRVARTNKDVLRLEQMRYFQQPVSSDFSNNSACLDYLGAKKKDLVLDFPLTRLSSSSISDISGFSMPFEGFFCSDGGWVEPTALCRALLDASGASFHFPVEICSVCSDDEGWSLFDREKQCVAKVDAVFFAHANGALEPFLFRHIPLFQVRGQLATFAATTASRELRTVLSGAGYLTPALNDRHVLGATYQRNDFGDRLRENEQRQLVDHFSDAYPTIADELNILNAPLQGRVSWRCSSENRLPVIGAVPDFDGFDAAYPAQQLRGRGAKPNLLPPAPYVPGLYVSLAHGSRGLSVAPLAAELLACLLTGEPLPVDAKLWEAIHPARYFIRERRRGRL